MPAPLLEVDNLRVCFGPPRRRVLAVDGVSFALERGERVALVGESGSGKSTVARALVRLVPAAAGAVRVGGRDLRTLRGRDLLAFRRRVQLVFQDPVGALDPRLTAAAALAEPLGIHFRLDAAARRARVAELLRAVELDPAMAGRYPHEFSGGQRQRLVIARALALDPELLIADEPVSALDVSVQAQVLNLLQAISAQRQCALLLIAHDLAVVRRLCARVLAMFRGRIVESGPTAAVLDRPAHPYTAALLAAVPDIGRALAGQRPAAAPPAETVPPTSGSGCPWRTRCPLAAPRCAAETPLLRPVGPERWSACHYA